MYAIYTQQTPDMHWNRHTWNHSVSRACILRSGQPAVQNSQWTSRWENHLLPEGLSQRHSLGHVLQCTHSACQAGVRADRHEFSQACMHAHRHSHSQAGFRQACSRPFPLDHIYLPPQGLSQRLLSPPQGLSQRLLSRNHVFITIYSNLYYFIAFYDNL